MKYFDMFSGIGGFRAGLSQIDGMQCIGHCEIDKYADKSYRSLFNTEGEWFCNDAAAIKPEEMPDFNLLCAGFPCQSFSIAGKRRGFDDTRGTMFFHIAGLVRKKRPEYLLLENVPGLLNHDKGRTFTTILGTLSELGYHVEWQVLNSKDFGVAQSRRRIYAFGFLREECAGKVLPFTERNGQALKQIIGGSQGTRVYDITGTSCTLAASSGGQGGKTGLYFVDLDEGTRITDIARCIKSRYNSGIGNHKGENSGVLECEKPIPILRPDRLNKRQNGKRFRLPKEPMFTIIASEIHGILQNGRIRRLTPSECLRLQGFSEEQIDKLKAVNSDNQLYKQAGNAVTVNVVKAIGERLKKLEDELKKEDIYGLQIKG
ncbi:MAG: DNA (cytosine-5-)-methyltransferase [Clostridia bacterium]|nr:DNA (cytosine-5-)-methyltransferase [Clostridia bacterium]